MEGIQTAKVCGAILMAAAVMGHVVSDTLYLPINVCEDERQSQQQQPEYRALSFYFYDIFNVISIPHLLS